MPYLLASFLLGPPLSLSIITKNNRLSARQDEQPHDQLHHRQPCLEIKATTSCYPQQIVTTKLLYTTIASS
jgi:hypothetical protein